MVKVPDLIGHTRRGAERTLTNLLLRHMAQFPHAAGDGKAATQSPAADTDVPAFTIVTVGYPSPGGWQPDAPVIGPMLPSGTYDGLVTGVRVGDPFDTGQGAWVEFATRLTQQVVREVVRDLEIEQPALREGSEVRFMGTLYFRRHGAPEPNLPRTEWMSRGAMLGLAQRAFTNGHRTRLVITRDTFVQSIQILEP